MESAEALKVVYFDPNVTDASGKWVGGTWIGKDKAETISLFFEGKGFSRKSSAELGKWMNEILALGLASSAVVIFAHDIAPFDVFDEFSSNCLIRQYLSSGGTILWVGDMPFYNLVKWDAKGKFWVQESPQPGAIHYLQILGVIPVSTIVASRSDLTGRGRKLGLKTPWPSLRPIVFPSQMETDRTRLGNVLRLRHEFIQLAHSEGIAVPSLRPLIRTGHLRRFLDLLGADSVKAGPLEISAVDHKKITPQDTKLDLEFSTKYLSGWIKIFNLSVKGSGFIRLWDFSPRVITSSMLEELYSILRNYCGERIESSSFAQE